ncbi:MAG: hypothetical protein J7M34_13830 [Anaerolineae bacterium]|nr:hypothetical protein [Anaerolineae bacterium]
MTHLVYGTRRRIGIRSQTGALYAISGIDGSGKTTQATTLCEAFQQCGVRTSYVWSRPGSSPLVAAASRLIGGRARGSKPGEDRTQREMERARRFRQPWVRSLWPWVIGLDLSILALGRVWPRLWLGRVVVADRYVSDALADLASRMGGTEVWRHPAIRLARWLAPRPRVTFLLTLNAEAALARKAGDEWLPLLRRQTEAYRLLAEDAYALDAEQPLDLIADEIVYRALTDYFDAFWTRLNVILLSNPKPLPPTLHQASAAWPSGR